MMKPLTLIFLIATLLTGCGPASLPPTTIVPITPSKTPRPTQTIIPTKTPSPTLSPTAFPILPTLPPKDAYALLLRMLNENDTCRLPCWLNITPHISTHAEAYQKWAGFLTLLGTTKIEPRDFRYDFQYNQNDFGYSINNFEFNLNDEVFSIGTRYYLQPNSDTIDSMYITTHASKVAENGIPRVFDSATYKKILDSYFLSNVLKKYGQPEQILLSMEIIEAEPTSPDYFRIWLLYPALGSIIQYWGNAEVENGVIYGCPSDTFVSLWLFPPSNAEMYQKILVESMSEPYSAYYKPTEDAIGMTQEEFYNQFSEPNSQCIESPLDIWPPH